MEVLFERSFERDLRRIKDKALLARVKRVIVAVKQADELNQVTGVLKLRGYEAYHRVRIGDYRVGIEVVGKKVIFVRFLHRKDIYRYFP